MSDPSRKSPSPLRRLRYFILLPLARLRFPIILAAIGLAIMKWDYLDAKFQQATGWHEHQAGTSGIEYFCPMHPAIVREDNKQKCPICNMPLSRRKKEDPKDDAGLPPGIVSRVQISPYRVVLAGVKTAPIAYQPLFKDIMSTGTVEFDERGLKKISARVKGRIDELLVNETGHLVKENEKLAVIYSAEFGVAIEALIRAHKSGNRDAEDDTRERLRRWGIDAKQIDKIVADGKLVTHMTVTAPIEGHVLRKYVLEGQYVEEGTPLYDLADIKTVWMQAQLYEDDLSFLPKSTHDPKSGLAEKKLRAMATTRAYPGRMFEGVLDFVYPHLDPDSRTLAVRFVLANKEHELRPGMTASVSLHLDAATLAGLSVGRLWNVQGGKVLAVPERSVIDTGEHKIVYRETVPAQYEGVDVKLGPRMTGPLGEIYFPVLDGLKADDLVVTNGSFLIDAETRLNPALGSIYIGGSGSKGSQPQVRPSTPEDTNEKIRVAMKLLSPADRALASSQKYCPILQTSRLGSMGEIVRIELNGKTVFLCCKNCVKEANDDPATTLARVEEFRKRQGPLSMTEKQRIERERYEKLSPEDKKLVDEQRLCPVTGEELLSMAVPIKMMVKGKPVMICCQGCKDDVEKNADEMLQKTQDLKTKKTPPKH